MQVRRICALTNLMSLEQVSWDTERRSTNPEVKSSSYSIFKVPKYLLAAAKSSVPLSSKCLEQ